MAKLEHHLCYCVLSARSVVVLQQAYVWSNVWMCRHVYVSTKDSWLWRKVIFGTHSSEYQRWKTRMRNISDYSDSFKSRAVEITAWLLQRGQNNHSPFHLRPVEKHGQRSSTTRYQRCLCFKMKLQNSMNSLHQQICCSRCIRFFSSHQAWRRKAWHRVPSSLPLPVQASSSQSASLPQSPGSSFRFDLLFAHAFSQARSSGVSLNCHSRH